MTQPARSPVHPPVGGGQVRSDSAPSGRSLPAGSCTPFFSTTGGGRPFSGGCPLGSSLPRGRATGSRKSLPTRPSLVGHGSFPVDPQGTASGVPSSVGLGEAHTLQVPPSLPSTSSSRGSGSHRPGSHGSGVQGRGLSGRGPQLSGLLLPTFRSSEVHGRFQANSGPVPSQHFSETHPLQDGHSSPCSSQHASERLVSLSRPEG